MERLHVRRAKRRLLFDLYIFGRDRFIRAASPYDKLAATGSDQQGSGTGEKAYNIYLVGTERVHQGTVVVGACCKVFKVSRHTKVHSLGLLICPGERQALLIESDSAWMTSTRGERT